MAQSVAVVLLMMSSVSGYINAGKSMEHCA